MSQLEVTQEAGRRIFSEHLDRPVVMLNLLRFREVADDERWPDLAPSGPISGAEAYARYAHEVMPFLEKAGSEVLFHGKGMPSLIGPPDDRWDEVLLVRHRSRQAFLEVASDKSYLAAVGHRMAALEDSRLVPVEQ